MHLSRNRSGTHQINCVMAQYDEEEHANTNRTWPIGPLCSKNTHPIQEAQDCKTHMMAIKHKQKGKVRMRRKHYTNNDTEPC